MLSLVRHADAASGRTFNIAGGRAHTLDDAAELVSRASGRPIAIEFTDPRSGEVTSYEADLGEARQILGCEPRVDLEEGLTRAAEWYLEHLEGSAPSEAEVPGQARLQRPRRGLYARRFRR